MSGEAGGIIVGGVLLAGALPYILAGAAVIGGAAGLAALGSSALRSRENRRESSLKVDRCSKELSDLYDRLRTAMDSQSARGAQRCGELEAQMRGFSDRLRQAAAESQDPEQLDRLLRQAREERGRALGAAREEALAQIQREGREEVSAAMAALQEAQQAKEELLDWKSGTAAARAGQQAMAQEFLRDAEATVRLLQSLEGSGGEEFRLRTAAVARSCETAARAVEEGAFEMAIAAARQSISRGASLAVEEEQKRLEADEAFIALESRLEGLAGELESQRRVVFEDPLYGSVEEYLDDFTQGGFERTLGRVQAMLARLRGPEGRRYGVGKLQLLLKEVEEELEPQAEEMIQAGHRELLHYYERLHALEAVSGYMKEQGYAIDWAQTAGDDATQKLVLHCSEPVSGNTIAVSLDEGGDPAEAGQMAMEVMFYYANGRPVTEDEKRALRAGMIGALEQKGLRGRLECAGCFDREAEDKTMDSMQSVRDLPAARRVTRDRASAGEILE